MQKKKKNNVDKGSTFDGWQTQNHGNTVQDNIERRLSGFFKVQTLIAGSGRTDAGVSSRGQVIHFNAIWDKDASVLHDYLSTGFGAHGPSLIQIYKLTEGCSF